ncbi:ABC transporter substrate-binding protein [Cupriavidus sp. TA19]|uniref:ABC transporter substrate-binding protein n=1 Tax=unclassified Cupriavidus TaxID=2640874 RepID=UPI000E2FBF2F|nr:MULTISPECIES: ABC transporter substrate-binding protein [unclassified Cupriavidus]BDB30677.1 ABC transporter substrate-binding protein [Cupriavidus sp. P-10]GLC97268.1 ABC transporter substrate-binding protein [Cupriavidus sp. TA19]
MKISRVVMLSVAVAIPIITSSTVNAESIVLANYGGTWAATLKKVCIDPYSKKTGITVTQAATGDSLAQIRVQQTTGNVLWDISPTEGASLPVAQRNGWLQPIDWKRVDPENKLNALARHPYAVGAIAYSTTIGYRTDKAPVGKIPSGWRDFWDVKKFPGPRTLRDSPIENLEFALIADGVPVDKVYDVLKAPGGVDRAFKKMDEIKPAITVWWTTGQQPVQLLASGDVFYASAFNGRITQIQKDKVPVAMIWNGGSLNVSYYSIQKGAKSPTAAMDFMKFCWNDPNRLAEIARELPYAGFNPEMFKLLSADEAKALPTAPVNVALQFTFNPDFWADHQNVILARWKAWRLQ